jgi:hypothetical protein
VFIFGSVAKARCEEIAPAPRISNASPDCARGGVLKVNRLMVEENQPQRIRTTPKPDRQKSCQLEEETPRVIKCRKRG